METTTCDVTVSLNPKMCCDKVTGDSLEHDIRLRGEGQWPYSYGRSGPSSVPTMADAHIRYTTPPPAALPAGFGRNTTLIPMRLLSNGIRLVLLHSESHIRRSIVAYTLFFHLGRLVETERTILLIILFSTQY